MMNRRNFVKTSLSGLAGMGLVNGCTGTESKSTSSGLISVDERTARDKFWIWSHKASVYNGRYSLPNDGLMTPVEGALYMGIPNVIFVRYLGEPEPPFFQYSMPFRAMKRVLWSITGANGLTSDEERAHIFELAAEMPNMTGLMMDDFFRDNTGVSSLSLEELKDIRSRLIIGDRRLDLNVVIYNHHQHMWQKYKEYLALCDTISLWTWDSEEIINLERNFEKLKEIAPDPKVFIGLYMWDFGDGRPVSIELMKHQCDLCMRWLRQGQIQGMIFLASNICDLGLETVEWSRRWIEEVGNEII